MPVDIPFILRELMKRLLEQVVADGTQPAALSSYEGLGMNRQIFSSFVSKIILTVLSGVILAILLFFARERLFPLPDVTGLWYVETHTVETTYDDYRDLMLRYVAVLSGKGSRIKGTLEKICEKPLPSKKQCGYSYKPDKRTRSEVDGYIDKKYFSKDRVYLHIVEEGRKRQSTHFHDLVVERKSNMEGVFTSSAANSEGKVTWRQAVWDQSTWMDCCVFQSKGVLVLRTKGR